MSGRRPGNLALMLCLAVQVIVAPWLPCPCRLWEGDTQRTFALQREGADQGESRCGFCEAGKDAQPCKHLPPTTRQADPCATAVEKTLIPDGHALACGVALLHGSRSLSPDVHELQVLLE